MRVAAIGIGSNSLRMLVADLTDGKLYRIKRYRAGLRIFAALDENRNITDEMIRTACDKVCEFKQEAISMGAEAVHLFATSAVRDAANQEAFSDALLTQTELPLEICSGDLEAHLSFWGASEGEESGVIDIGGGSTEIVLGSKGTITDAVSLQMGAVRLYRMQPIQSIQEAEQVVLTGMSIIEPVRQRFLSQKKTEWTGVGGTFTTGAAVVQRIPWQMRENIHGFKLTMENVQQALELLAPMSVEERLKLDYLQPQRADIVVHGIAILLACMRSLNISSITVSECGNLEGYLKVKYLFDKKN
ncbi:MAG: hypothetical protein J6K55_07965 [Clostridia bacterium]|nr:hypothetical protein [Clostridia bacterium]